MRTRSEYRLSPIPPDVTAAGGDARAPIDSDRRRLAELMLDAYRGTIDDEGESVEDALAAIDFYFATFRREHSFVLSELGVLRAFAFVVVVDDVNYIDPVVVAPDQQHRGVGGEMVRICLGSLARAGLTEVGATITDGNVASERLFLGLGFSRRGVWGA